MHCQSEKDLLIPQPGHLNVGLGKVKTLQFQCYFPILSLSAFCQTIKNFRILSHPVYKYRGIFYKPHPFIFAPNSRQTLAVCQTLTAAISYLSPSSTVSKPCSLIQSYLRQLCLSRRLKHLDHAIVPFKAFQLMYAQALSVYV